VQAQEDQARGVVQAIMDSPDMSFARRAVADEVARKHLQIRSDRDIYAGTSPRLTSDTAYRRLRSAKPFPCSLSRQLCTDLNLREAFVDLLLSYQSPWLQLGLEVLLGVQVERVRISKGRDGQLLRLSTPAALRKLIVQVRGDAVISCFSNSRGISHVCSFLFVNSAS
jgi:hypothetical protein